MGANHELTVADVHAAADRIETSGAFLTQFEVPLECALAGLRIARSAGVPAILNPAPARSLPREVLADVDILTPNQTELRILLGRPADDPADDLDLCRAAAGRRRRHRGHDQGAAGALIVRPGDVVAVPSQQVQVVDSTGAGDAFNGTLATFLATGSTLEAAVAPGHPGRGAGLPAAGCGAGSALSCRAGSRPRLTPPRGPVATSRSWVEPRSDPCRARSWPAPPRRPCREPRRARTRRRPRTPRRTDRP